MLAHLETLGLALGLEAIFGYPQWLQQAVGHPVQAAGWLIARLDRLLNRQDAGATWRRVAGCLSLGLLVTLAWGAAAAVEAGCAHLPPALSLLLRAMIASTLFAQRSLYDHVHAVGEALTSHGTGAARRAVGRIVGRNTDRLDPPAILRAAIESLAENFSDGIVAPAVCCALGGLPGLFVYKTVNTADSMIGHLTPRHAAFGWAAARVDDLLNLAGARLSALLLALSAAFTPTADAAAALRTALRDAGKHRSPNAGWPEAAMAGALGLRLNGPRVYGQILVQDAWMGDGRSDVTRHDLTRALALYRTACAAQLAIVAIPVLGASLS